MPLKTAQRVFKVLDRLFPPKLVVSLDAHWRNPNRSGNGQLPTASQLAGRISMMSEIDFRYWISMECDPDSLCVLMTHLVALPHAIKRNDHAAVRLRRRINAATTDAAVCLIALEGCGSEPSTASRYGMAQRNS